ncbi:phospholipid-binding protein MlaC [Tabrizicola sp.]|jgi:phospholipid transport system substrate-binding protein|uniref:MlaC/ttg2D family ABC transporter substrate-binding protein n=1 Tax=Tabrizicola sp. TaxID=2005166 RepID=UPI0025DC13E3|nr:ABC transporter substrate-binding protein [Tabrizicola sp.]MDK2773432.1 ABC transporter substrate-binding protein [Tabrizicola sp.]
MPSDITLSRRGLVAGLATATLLATLPRPAAALTAEDAKTLVDKTVAEINAIINSGKSEGAMLQDFERLFSRYADVPTIARSVLGTAARSASSGQLSGYTKAFQGYISRKYGRRFREFEGGQIDVADARPLKSYFEVISTARLKGEAPFEVRWHVSDKSGKSLFFNIIIEGVNMLASERTEMGALLDQRGGDLDRLIADLQTL